MSKKTTKIEVDQETTTRTVAQDNQLYLLQNHDGNLMAAQAVIVQRAGDDLVIIYADGTKVVLEGFFLVEAEVSLAEEDGDARIIASDSEGVALEDGGQLIWAQGEQDTLLEMAQGNEALVKALATADFSDGGIAWGGVLLGLGIAGGIAAAAGGGSGSSSDSPLVFDDLDDEDDATNVLETDASDFSAAIDGEGGEKTFTIDAQDAEQVDLVGQLVSGTGDGAEQVVFTIDDIEGDARTLTINTDNLSSDDGAHRLVFDFSDNADYANDVVTLGSDSTLGAFSEIEVVAGTVNVLGVNLPAGTVFTINSGLQLSVAQFLATPSITSVTGHGEVTIVVSSADDVTALQNFVEQSQEQVLIGAGYTIEVADGVVVADGWAAGIQAALDAVTYPSIPEMSIHLNSLQEQVDDLSIGDISDLSAELSALSDAISALDGNTATAIDDFEADLATAQSTLQTAIDTLAGAAEAEAARLEGLIESNDTDIAANLSAIADLDTALSALETLVGENDTAAAAALTSAQSTLQTAIDTVAGNLTTEVAALQTQIDGNDTDIAANVADIAANAAAITTLQTLVGENDTAAAEALSTAQTTLQAAIDTVAGNLTTEVADLQNQIDGNDTDIAANVSDIADLDAAVIALQSVLGQSIVSASTDVSDGDHTVVVGENDNTVVLGKVYVDDEGTFTAAGLSDIDTVGAFVLKNLSDAVSGNANNTISESYTEEFGNNEVVLNLADLAAGETLTVYGFTVSDEEGRGDVLRFADVEDQAALNAGITQIELATNLTPYGDVFIDKEFLSVKITFAGGGSIELIDLVSSDLAGTAAALAGDGAYGTAITDAAVIGQLTGMIAAENVAYGIEPTMSALIDLHYDLSTAQTTLQTAIDTLAGDMEDEAARLEGLIESNDTDIAANLSDIADLDTALTALETLVGNNDTAAAAALTAAQTTLQNAIDTLAGDMEAEAARLEGLIESNDTDIAANVSDIAANAAAITALQNLVGDNDTAAAEALSTAQTTLQNAIDALAGEVETDLAALQTQVDDLAIGDISGLSTSLNSLNDAVTALQTLTGDDGALDTRLDAIEATLAGITDTVVAYVEGYVGTAESEEGADDATGLFAAIADLQAQIAALSAASSGGVSDLADDISDINTTLTALDGSLTALEALVGDTAVATQISTAITALQTTLEGYTDDAVAALQAQIEGLGEGESFSVEDYSTIASLNSAVQALEGVVSGDAATEGTLAYQLAALQTTLEGYADDAVAALQAQLEGLGEGESFSVEDYSTIASLNSAVQDLEGVVSGDAATEGTLAYQLAALQNTLETYTDNAITQLESDLSGALEEGDYATLKALSDAVSALENAGTAASLSGLQSQIDALDARLDALEAQPEIWDGGTAELSAAEVFNAGGSFNWATAILPEGLTPADVFIGESVYVDGDGVSTGGGLHDTVTLADIAADGTYTVPQGYALVTYDAYVGVMSGGGDYIAPGNDYSDYVGTINLANLDLVNLGNGLSLMSEAAFRVYLLESVEVPAGELDSAVAAWTLMEGGSRVNVDFIDSFSDLIAGYDPATITLDIDGALTLAQAVALLETGFDLENNVSYSIEDAFTTVQAALSDPDRVDAISNAEKVIADGNELDNLMDFIAIDSDNLTVEAGAGDDTVNAGAGDETIIGQLGADSINLTSADTSADTVVYQTVYDGQHLPVTSVQFSTDTDLYLEDAVLTLTINGTEYSHTVTADESGNIEAALSGLVGEISEALVPRDVSDIVVGRIMEIGGSEASTAVTVADLDSNGSYSVPDGYLFYSMTDMFKAFILNGGEVGLQTDIDTLVSDYNYLMFPGEVLTLSAELYTEDYVVDESVYRQFLAVAGVQDVDAYIEELSVNADALLASVTISDATLKLIGLDADTVLTVEAGGDVEAAIAHSGTVTSATIVFSGTASDWPTLTNDDNTTQFDRELSVTIDTGDDNDNPDTTDIDESLVTVSAAVVYGDDGVVDPAASVAALVTAINDDEDLDGLLTASSDGTTLTLLGDAVPATEDDVPTFSVTSAQVDQNGSQQEVALSFSTDNDDYYEGGTLSVTIEGVEISADMVAGDAVASVTALQQAIEAAKAEVVDPGEPYIGEIALWGNAQLTDALNTTGTSYTTRYDLNFVVYDNTGGSAAYDFVATHDDQDAPATLGALIDYLNAEETGTAGVTWALDSETNVLRATADIGTTITALNSMDYITTDTAAFTATLSEGVMPNNTLVNPALAALESVEQGIDYSSSHVGTDGTSLSGEDGYQSETLAGYSEDLPISIYSTFRLEIEDSDAPNSTVIYTVENLASTTFDSLADLESQLFSQPYYYDDVTETYQPYTLTEGHTAPTLSFDPETGVLTFGVEEGGVYSATSIIGARYYDAASNLTLTAATEAVEPLTVSDVTQDYAGVAQQAIIDLEDSLQYTTYSDGTSTERGADVYYAGGKVYATITPVDEDGNADTDNAVTISTDMVSGTITSWSCSLPDNWDESTVSSIYNGFQLSATYYDENGEAIENKLFSEADETLAAFIARYEENFPNLDVELVDQLDGSINLVVTLKPGISVDTSYVYGVYFFANDENDPAGNNMNYDPWDVVEAGAEENALALAEAINAQTAEGGSLYGLIDSAAADGSEITLTAAEAGVETFNVSNVTLDYSGVKQQSTITLDDDSAYDTTFTDGSTVDDGNFWRGADVYYAGGKAYVTITPQVDDGEGGLQDGTPVTVSADMAQTESSYTVTDTNSSHAAMTLSTALDGRTGIVIVTQSGNTYSQGTPNTYDNTTALTATTVGELLNDIAALEFVESAELGSDGLSVTVTLVAGEVFAEGSILHVASDSAYLNAPEILTVEAADATSQALAEAIQAEIDGEPAIQTIDSTISLTESTGITLDSGTVTIGTNDPISLTGSVANVADLLALIEAVDGIASAVIDPENGQQLLITSDARGADASIQVSLVVNDGDNLIGYINSSFSDPATGSDGDLSGLLESATYDSESGDITLTAAEAGVETFSVSDVTLDYAGVKQQATITLDADNLYDTTFSDGSTVDDGDFGRGADVYYEGGKVYVTITPTEGEAVIVSADMTSAPNGDVVIISGTNAFTGNEVEGQTPNPSITFNGETTIAIEQQGTLSDYLIQLNASELVLSAEIIQTGDNAGSLMVTTAPGVEITNVYFLYYYETLQAQTPDSFSYDVIYAPSDAELTAQALTEAINAQTAEEGSLYGLIESATYDSEYGDITLTAAVAGEQTFSVSAVTLDYAGVNQIATADFSTADADYYEGGTLSMTIDTTPDNADDPQNNITVTADMVDGDAAASIQALVDQFYQTVTVKLEVPDATDKGDTVPQVTAVGTDGAYVVVWQGEVAETSDIYVQKFNADGTTDGDLVLLEGVTGNADAKPQVTAVGTAGAYVVTWEGVDADDDNSIYVQKFAADGTTDGETVMLEAPEHGTSDDTVAQVTAVGTDGSFVVVWQGNDALNNDLSIFVQKFDGDGNLVGTNPVALEPTDLATGHDHSPQVTALGTEGAFVVTWYGNDATGEDYSIYVQQFNAVGTTGEYAQIKLEPPNAESYSDLYPQVTAIGSTGEYVVVWAGLEGESSSNVYVQKFAADGTTGEYFVVTLAAAGVTVGTDVAPQVTALGTAGAFVVAWAANDAVDNDYSIYVQKFSVEGAADGEPIKLEAAGVDVGNDLSPRITALGTDGSFVVSWVGVDDEGGDESIFVQRFAAEGATDGEQIKLEAAGVADGDDVAVQVTALGTDGAFVVTWSGVDENGDASVYVQQFDADGAPVEAIIPELADLIGDVSVAEGTIP